MKRTSFWRNAFLAGMAGLALLAVASCSMRHPWSGASGTYDPVMDTWHEANRAVEYEEHGSALVEHLGTLYQFTGSHTYACDLATDTWTVRCDAPAEQHFGTAFEIHDRIYVFLGGNLGCGMNVPRWVGEYNPVLDEWGLLADVPDPCTWSFAACVNDRIYLMGGRREGDPAVLSGDVWEYEPLADKWTLNGSILPRASAVAVGVGIYIYVFGGQSDDPLDEGDKVFTYTPASGSTLWRNDIDVAGEPELSVGSPQQAVLLDGKVYVVRDGPWADLLVYDFYADTWDTATGPGYSVRGVAAAGSRLYAFGGQPGAE